MGFLCIPRTSRKMQRTLKNLRVSLLCFLLTFLVLRNTIGAGKFGTPAQDFEEIKQHLHYVGLHRRHFRVLAEAVEEEEGKQRETPMLTLERRSPLLEEEAMQRNAASLLVYKEKQGNALTVRQSNAPLLTSRPLEGLLEGNAGFQKDQEVLTSWDEQRKVKEALAHSSYGDSRVLLVSGIQSSACKNPAGEHFLLKSLQNKVGYSTLHGLEISLSFEGLDPQLSKPMSKLSLLQKSLLKYPHVEWLWWLPNDALITNMALQLPLQHYSEFNLVLLGSDDKAHHHHPKLINLNTDSFLIRNCQWSLDLLRACAMMSSLQGDQAGRVLTNSLFKGPRLESGDQSAFIYLLNQEKKDLSGKVHVEPAVLRITWRDAAEKFERIVKQSQRGIGGKGLPFVTHFLGCNFCNKVADKGDEMCVKQAERALVFAEKQSMQSYGVSIV